MRRLTLVVFSVALLFSIGSSQTIVVTSPNGGEIWVEGSQQTITWTSTGWPTTINYVKIEYSTNGGGTWFTVDFHAPNTGMLNWVVPLVSSTRANCVVRISDATNPSTHDISNGTFTILNEIANVCASGYLIDVQPVLQSKNDAVHYPGDEDWYKFYVIGGYSYVFYTDGTTDTYGEIYFSCGETTPLISDDNSGEGNNFKIRYTPTGSGYRYLKVRGNTTSDVGNYTLYYTTAPYITVNRPTGPDSLNEGSVSEIQWTTHGAPPIDSVKIEYSTTGPTGPWTLVTNSTPNTGSYLWNVPLVTSTQTNCYVRVSDAVDGDPWDINNSPFKIKNVTPAITVVRPITNDTLDEGFDYEITWTSVALGPSANVAILYSLSGTGGPWITITTSTPNDGSYIWTVPLVDSLESDCYVIVKEATTGTPTDITNAPFYIRDDAPNTCNNPVYLNVTETERTRLESIRPAGDVDWFVFNAIVGHTYVFYSVGNTNTYAELYNLCNGTLLAWDDTSGPGDNFKLVFTPAISGLYFIKVRGATPAVTGSYNLKYQIVPGITVTSPNGGETWAEKTYKTITWTSVGTPAIPYVKIEYSTTGQYGPWNLIVSSTQNDGSYSWMLPEVYGNQTNCFVKISHATDGLPFDISDSRFTIKDSSDAGNACSLATTIVVDTIHRTQVDAIAPAGEFDWYKFHASAGYTYVIYSEGVTNTYAQLYSNCTGALLLWDDNSGEGNNFKLEFTPATTGIYYLKVRGSVPSVSGIYTLHFYATRPYFAVLSPNGGEEWEEGSVQTIRWTSTGIPPTANVNIAYSTDNGTTWNPAANSVPNTGAYVWALPNLGTTYNHCCLVKISESTTGLPYDISDHPFSILVVNDPRITIVTPDSGMILDEGSQYDITWTTVGLPAVNNVKVEYSLNGTLGPWHIIRHSMTNTGILNWTLPLVDSNETDCYIRVSDATDGVPFDLNNYPFTIRNIPPSTTDAPNLCAYALSLSITDIEQSRIDTISPGGDIDWYRFYANSGYTYVFYTCGLTNTDAEICSSCEGDVLTFDENSGYGNNFRIEFTPAVSGTYYLKVRGHHSYTTGTYSLRYYRLPATMKPSITVGTINNNLQKASLISLDVFPNPFNTTISIAYNVHEKMKILIDVSDISGRKIETLVDEKIEAGKHTINWTPAEDVHSGLYFIRIQTDDETLIKQVILVK